jgi:hypothetical protein
MLHCPPAIVNDGLVQFPWDWYGPSRTCAGPVGAVVVVVCPVPPVPDSGDVVVVDPAALEEPEPVELVPDPEPEAEELVPVEEELRGGGGV